MYLFRVMETLKRPQFKIFIYATENIFFMFFGNIEKICKPEKNVNEVGT